MLSFVPLLRHPGREDMKGKWVSVLLREKEKHMIISSCTWHETHHFPIRRGPRKSYERLKQPLGNE